MPFEDFQFLEHSADLKFLARGKSLEECFQNSAKAMFSGMLDLNSISSKTERKIKAQAHDLENLLHDFLSELLFLFETSDLVFNKFEVEISKNDEYSLYSLVGGEKVNLEKHKIHTEIKAVTYHDLSIKKGEEEVWKATVLCDI